MAYAGVTATLDLLPVLPQTSSNAGYTLTVSRLTSHIVRADSLINSKIAKRYDVSVFNTSTSTPPLLTSLSQDMASYLHLRSVFSADNQNVNEWADKFNEALGILDEIRDGKLDLVNSLGSIVSEKSTSSIDLVDSNTKNYQGFFDEDEPTSWKVNSDKLDSIGDNR